MCARNSRTPSRSRHPRTLSPRTNNTHAADVVVWELATGIAPAPDAQRNATRPGLLSLPIRLTSSAIFYFARGDQGQFQNLAMPGTQLG
jgi:hypothetical protein